MIRSLNSLIKRFAPEHLRRHQLLLAATIVLQAAATVAVVPLIIALANRDTMQALAWLAVLIVTVLLSWPLERALAAIGLTIGFQILERLQAELAGRIVRIPHAWMEHKHHRVAIDALSSSGPDLVSSIGYIYAPTISAFTLPLILAVGVGTVGILAGTGPVILLLGLAAYLVLLGAWFGAATITRKADRVDEQTHAELTDSLVEFAQNQQVLRAAGVIADEQSRVGNAVRASTASVLRVITLSAPGLVMFGLAMQLALLGISAASIWEWAGGDISGAVAVALIVVTVRMVEPMGSLAGLSSGINRVSSMVDSIQAILAAPQLPLSDVNRMDAASDSGHKVADVDIATGAHEVAPPLVQLQDVSFSYGETEVLHDISLEFQPGSATALIGPSGAGKSTLMWLIAGLDVPDSGQVQVEGQTAAPGKAAVVFQFPYLFDVSVMENVAAGNRHQHVSESVIDAARLTDVIAPIEHNIGDTPGHARTVGEGGSRLSGGERQRVSIARALASESRLLLIDEATSALDAENEVALRQALSLPGYTRIVIAHHPQAIRGIARVVVMDKGRIVADGSPEDVAATNEYMQQFLAADTVKR